MTRLLLAVILAGCATPRPAAPNPEPGRQTEAPQPSVTVGSAGASADVESGGASPMPALPPTGAATVPVVSMPATTLRGIASWYCLPGRSPCTVGFPADGAYAAAGPALRVGAWRGRVVRVNGIDVRLIDWCACPERIIDLYAGVFAQLAPLSAGLVTVEVEW